MFNQLLSAEWQVLAAAQPHWARAKRLLLVMLSVWMSYFLLVSAFVHSLNKIEIPLLGIPLGSYLAAQGAAILFVITLVRLARYRG